MSSFYIVVLGALIVSGLMIYRIILTLRAIQYSKKQLDHASERTLTDLSDQEIYTPENIQRVIADLNHLGFRRLGECSMFYPELTDVQRFWVLVDEPTTTRAAIIALPASPFVSFETIFPDDAWLETVGEHPRLAYTARVELPDLRFGAATPSNAQNAYRTHLSRMKEFGKIHGVPLPTQSISDYFRYMEVWASRHRIAQMKTALRQDYESLLGNSIVFLILILCVIVTVLYATRTIHISSRTYELILGGVVSLYIIPLILRIRHHRQQRL